MGLEHGDPDGEVAIALLAKEQLREVYNAEIVFDTRRRLIEFCDTAEVSAATRLARTIRRWETPLLC